MAGNKEAAWARAGIGLVLGIIGGIIAGPVGFMIGYTAGTIVGSFVFPIKNKSKMPTLSDYPIQGAEKGVPVPVIKGTCRVAGNFIWLGKLRKKAVEAEGAKSGAGSEGAPSEIKYYRSFLIGVCMGEAEVLRAWAGNKEIELTKFTWFNGNNNVGIPALTGEEYSTYKNLACAYFQSYYLGGSSQIPNFTFEIKSVDVASGENDLPISAVIKSVIEEQLPQITLSTASFNAAEAYCIEKGLYGSFYFKEQKPLWDWVDYICSHMNAFRYRSNGQMCLGIFKNDDPIAELTSADFVCPDLFAKPIQISKRQHRETFNRIEVLWTNRANKYQESVVVASDDVDLSISGNVIRKFTARLTGITSSTVALMMGYRLLADSMYRINTYKFVIAYKNMVFEINDVITINDGEDINKKVRILSVAEDLTGSALLIEAVEEIDYLDEAFGSQDNEHEGDDEVVLGDGMVAYAEDIINNNLYLSIAPTVEDTNGWYIYKSYDDSTYKLIGVCGIADVVDGEANSRGQLQTELPAYPTLIYRAADSFTVDIGTVTDLLSTTDTYFYNNLKLCKVGNEIIAYKTCAETPAGSGIWVITGLIRGLFGTTPEVHSIDASGVYSFATLDKTFSYTILPSDVGKVLYFKALSYYGDDQQEIEDVDSVAIRIMGSYTQSAGVGLLRLTANEEDGGGSTYSGATFTLYWNLPGKKGTGFNQGGYDLNTTYPLWHFGHSESELTGGNGVNYGNYTADGDIQYIDLVFETTGGVYIGERSISGTAISETITKATDLGGNVSAVIKVYPRTSIRTSAEASITVTQV